MKKAQTTNIEIIVYSKTDCHLCDVVKETILKVREDINFEFREIDIETDTQLFEEYKEKIPVVFINNRKAFKYKVDEKELRKKLERLLK